MKPIFLTAVFIIMTGIFTFSAALAVEKADCIYGSRIDQLISFYQRRLYLLDSEYTILSDIGKDAMEMTNYLQEQKSRLVREMKEQAVDFRSKEMNTYVVKKARRADVARGYSTPE